ncbi:MAG: transcription initiation factor IIB, partial [Candidatus Ranarchaeia archaeon]
EGPEWRAFNSEERDKKARTGSPSNYMIHDYGLSTVIDWRDRDIYGRKFNSSRRAQIYRMRKWQIRTRVHSSVERNLMIALGELGRLASQLGVPEGVKQTAAVIYRRIIERRLIRGRSIEAMVAASLYAACRVRKVPRTLDEIANGTRTSRKELGRCYRLILQKTNLKIPIAGPNDFISRFAAELRLAGETQREAVRIIQKAKDLQITAGKDPTGLAAAAIYISGLVRGDRRTQREIAEVAYVTEVTVRNRYKELIRRLDIQIPL